MELLRQHQLNIMLFMSGICCILSLLAFLTKSMPKKRRLILTLMELNAALLLLVDRFAYFFSGDLSIHAYWMVRISTFAANFISLLIIFGFNLYLTDLCKNEEKHPDVPLRLRFNELFFILGIILLIISQKSGLFYTFDEYNRVQRGSYFLLSYLFPFASLILELSVIIQFYTRLSQRIRLPLISFTILPIVASFFEIFTHGLSLTNITLVGEVALLYAFVLVDMNDTVQRMNKLEIEFLKEEQQKLHIMFEQTAEALANAIDAKDPYTHGHSTRVAEYSKQIAILAKKSDKECEEVYFAGLLHDVGKIGIPNSIINKEGKLTDEEFGEIKKHPVIGHQILSSITESPHLCIGAMYHHERYDGKGYPSGLKGPEIPDIARIIAVADAYDAMTSRRSYRDPIPQQKVREEIVKGSGFQFDPAYAKIMLHLIDLDTNYLMKEHEKIRRVETDTLECKEFRRVFSEGIHLTDSITKIKLHFQAYEKYASTETIPSVILFDSLDGKLQLTEKMQNARLYCEYGIVRFDGKTEQENVRNTRTDISTIKEVSQKELLEEYKKGIDFEIEAVKYEDHVKIIITSPFQSLSVIFALQDCSRYAYLSLTGEYCTISDIDIQRAQEKVDSYYIRRIAEKISFIKVPEGDIPNIQIDDWCSAATQGIPITEGLELSFHTMSLPTSYLIWHCPFVSIFYSSDKKYHGQDFMEFAILRLDGENWDSYDYVDNKITITKTEEFGNWNEWKEKNKQGYNCLVKLKRSGNIITMETTNCGISIKSTTIVKALVPEILVALTGDQCAITNIRIRKTSQSLISIVK